MRVKRNCRVAARNKRIGNGPAKKSASTGNEYAHRFSNTSVQ
jgi:hypothetical protein